MSNRIKGNYQSFNIKDIPVTEWNKLKIIHLREGLGQSLSEFCLNIILNYVNEYIKKNKLGIKPKKSVEEEESLEYGDSPIEEYANEEVIE